MKALGLPILRLDSWLAQDSWVDRLDYSWLLPEPFSIICFLIVPCLQIANLTNYTLQ